MLQRAAVAGLTVNISIQKEIRFYVRGQQFSGHDE